MNLKSLMIPAGLGLSALAFVSSPALAQGPSLGAAQSFAANVFPRSSAPPLSLQAQGTREFGLALARTGAATMDTRNVVAQ